MQSNHSVLHFFWIYFSSVALLIIGGGFFYYYEQKSLLISAEHDSILQYAKMQQYTDGHYTEPGFSFERMSKYKSWYEKDSLKQEGGFFIYEASTQEPNEFLIIKKSRDSFNKAKEEIFFQMLLVELILLGLFSLISWALAKESIRPLHTMIANLDDFIKNLVHDLNTPATSILLNARLLKTKKGENDGKRIERIESSTKEILALYNNLSILLNEHKLDQTPQDIVPIIRTSMEHFKQLYKDIDFQLDLSESSLLNIDRQAFEQIFNNLLSNACKYSHKTAPKVEITLRDNQLEIKDNGMGMEHPQKVFDRLYSEQTQGHGIGMHIVKKLTEAMGIKIEFWSEKGVGTQVRLIFS